MVMRCCSFQALLFSALFCQRWSLISGNSLRATAANDEARRESWQVRAPLRAVVSTNGKPFAPLQKCEGDCDSDDECAGNLKCFQRDGFETVPGCFGGGTVSGMDFCYDEADSIKQNDIFGSISTTLEVPSEIASAQIASTEVASAEVVVMNGFFSTPTTILGKCEGTCTSPIGGNAVMLDCSPHA